MLMTPEEAFLPNCVPCGPLRTSTRSRSPSELIGLPKGMTTLSTTVPTFCSDELEKPPAEPTPRRRKPESLGEVPNCTPENWYWMSVSFWKPLSESWSPVIADTAIGTSCRRSALRDAVTMMSPGLVSSTPREAICEVAVSCAIAGVATAPSAMPVRRANFLVSIMAITPQRVSVLVYLFTCLLVYLVGLDACRARRTGRGARFRLRR